MFSHWMSAAAAASANNNINNTNISSSSSTTPPDCILQIGPPPYFRYTAHSALLAAHSGFLRAALRAPAKSSSPLLLSLDANASPTALHSSSPPPPTIHVPNITIEQFGPLLTYMYTGYLNVTVDNIFAVLLATHVLHMPRAAEICRTFLSSHQHHRNTGGTHAVQSTLLPHASSTYAAASAHHNQIEPAHIESPAHQQQHNHNAMGFSAAARGRIIRPIASKATVTSNPATCHTFGAPLMTTATRLLPSKDTPFRVLLQQFQQSTTVQHQHVDVVGCRVMEKTPENACTTVRVHVAAENTRANGAALDDDLTVGHCDVDGVVAVKRRRFSPIKGESRQSSSTPPASSCKRETAVVQTGEVLEGAVRFNEAALMPYNKQQTPLSNSNTIRNCVSNKKTIIDIASCDGPVRFRRVLNEAYGMPTPLTTNVAAEATERNAQLVATSFHLQMAKTMRNHHNNHEQLQLEQNCTTERKTDAESDSESENSQREISVSSEATNPEPPAAPVGLQQQPNYGRGTTNVGQQPLAEEVYVCVYCKHTFKSQYCFQKHAKRHINPLSVHETELLVKKTPTTTKTAKFADINITTTSTTTNALEDGILATAAAASADDTIGNGSTNGQHPAAAAAAAAASKSGTAASNAATTIVRREVRPLDMNVQYYPCKTCGSKFPSYYFVHKHRKLCHENEDN